MAGAKKETSPHPPRKAPAVGRVTVPEMSVLTLRTRECHLVGHRGLGRWDYSKDLDLGKLARLLGGPHAVTSCFLNLIFF